jgi:hypothetical protein
MNNVRKIRAKIMYGNLPTLKLVQETSPAMVKMDASPNPKPNSREQGLATMTMSMILHRGNPSLPLHYQLPDCQEFLPGCQQIAPDSELT